jgi:glyceraldehyde 3-phosphate dehydrogenase
MNIAINGFGRIGRATFKILLEHKEKGEDINIVAINDLGSVESLAYLLKYDTTYGRYEKMVEHKEGALIVDGVEYKMLAIKEPLQLPWKDLNVDIVIECTGIFTASEMAKQHLTAGAKKLVLSAPAKDDGFQTLVFGSDQLHADSQLVSNASCTTNSITPIIRILNDAFGVEKALLTTVHAYTATQALVDGPSKKDLREGRAAAQNIIPSSTGAAKATGKAMPSMAGIFDGISLRVPVICGSISDITAVLKKDVTAEEVNAALKAAAERDDMKHLVMYTEEPLVSHDIIKTSYSAIIDGEMTRVVGGNLVKVLAWYDNEWGYSNRLVEMAVHLCRSL